MKKQGYLIVETPARFIRQYENSRLPKHFQTYLAELRREFAEFDPEKYRGISRNPFEADPYPSSTPQEPSEFAAAGIDVDKDKKARERMFEIQLDKITADLLSDLEMEEYDESCFDNLDDALTIYRLLDSPAEYEIICTRRIHFTNSSRVLGFDLGQYYYHDHYSLISDTVVAPEFHPAPPGDFPELRERLRCLNQNLLFNSPDDAKEFREYYITKDWAEEEGYEGEFAVIQVEEVPVSEM